MEKTISTQPIQPVQIKVGDYEKVLYEGVDYIILAVVFRADQFYLLCKDGDTNRIKVITV